ncbi:hypothetical protein F4553_006417 [Allocatelliglobosispora scoriae]|uniref:Uncharacterized protein n=1 Tax=Allocatelliglobosispora scoriae TaxID=643052 RepID=A0A841C1G3_9ACTN|nr:hypothetical protein [Allocatelliglobosispora scoriae]MBB5872983.1 hypothetical protein [Allocatelliglobosispora scoriae]
MGDIIGIITAGISVLGAIVAGVLTTWSSQRTRRLEHALEQQKHEATKAERAAEVLSRYREPLLLAAVSLQGRIFNVVRDEYLPRYLHSGDEEQEQYARDFTVYTLTEYLCWVVIIRRELRFLDLGDDARNKEFTTRLMAVETTLSHSGPKYPPHFRLFRGQQRAIGELMMVPGPNGGHEAMTYASFCARLDSDPVFAKWFARLRSDVDEISSNDDTGNLRLIHAQNSLIDLIDFLDPDQSRVVDDRSKYVPRPRVAEQVSGRPVAG